MKTIQVGSAVAAVFVQVWAMFAVHLFCTGHWIGGAVATGFALLNLFSA